MNGPSRKFWSQPTTSNWSVEVPDTQPAPQQFMPSILSSISHTSTLNATDKAYQGSSVLASPHTRRAMGYFAFPPSGYATTVPSGASLDNEEKLKSDQAQERQRRKEAEESVNSAWTSRLERDAQIHRQRLACEEAEAQRGEEEWVRSGGILRDAEGRRDLRRTEAVRDELRLRDIEQGLMRRWEAYEKKWKELLTYVNVNGAGSGRNGIGFHDVPWPVDLGDAKRVTLADITVDKVEDFLLGGLKVRGCEVSKKERVRNSLLRWHPDKMTGVLARVADEDVEAVRQGISVVIICLQHLNSKI